MSGRSRAYSAILILGLCLLVCNVPLGDGVFLLLGFGLMPLAVLVVLQGHQLWASFSLLVLATACLWAGEVWRPTVVLSISSFLLSIVWVIFGYRAATVEVQPDEVVTDSGDASDLLGGGHRRCGGVALTDTVRLHSTVLGWGLVAAAVVVWMVTVVPIVISMPWEFNDVAPGPIMTGMILTAPFAAWIWVGVKVLSRKHWAFFLVVPVGILLGWAGVVWGESWYVCLLLLTIAMWAVWDALVLIKARRALRAAMNSRERAVNHS